MLGNISDTDVFATVDAAGAWCAPDATLLWSRGRNLDGRGHDLDEAIRRRFGSAGFVETGYATLERGSRPTVGRVRYVGAPVALPADERLFTFHR